MKIDDKTECDYGEGELVYGKMIPKLTASQKAEIEESVRFVNGVIPDHPFTEDSFRRTEAFRVVFGRDELIKRVSEIYS